MAYLYHLETLQINKLINKVTINDVILVHKVSRLSFHDTHYLSIIGLDLQTGMTSTQQTDRQTDFVTDHQYYYYTHYTLAR